jgi:transcriptional regulator with XRE-family HTH domain
MAELRLTVIGDQIRLLRQAKNLSQSDIEMRTGLRRCYISRVECAHIVPSLETIEKFARALRIPLYQLFIGDKEIPERRELQTIVSRKAVGPRSKIDRDLQRIRNLLAKMSESNRVLLLHVAHRMGRRRRRRASSAELRF